MKFFYADADEKQDISFYLPYSHNFMQEKVQASLQNIFSTKNYMIDFQHFHIKLEQKNSRMLPF